MRLAWVHSLCNYIHLRSLTAEHFCTDNDYSPSGRKGSGQPVSFVSICGSIRAAFTASCLRRFHACWCGIVCTSEKKENCLAIWRSILGQCSAWLSWTGTSGVPRETTPWFITTHRRTVLTLNLLMWRIWWAPNNASIWQMEFNSAFKGLMWFD